MKKIICLLLCFVMLTFSACKSDTVISMSFGVSELAGSFDPQVAEGSTAKIIVKNCFEGLVRYDENANIIAGVAQKWEISKDLLTYTFYLREDAVWHITSNAKKQLEEKLPEDFSFSVTANDFEFALKRAVDPATGAPDAALLKNISSAAAIMSGEADVDTLGVEATDDYTLKITLSQPQSNFLDVLTQSICMPCNETFFNACGGRYGMFIKYFLSNGPFYLSYFDESSYRISKSSDYSGEVAAVADVLWFYYKDSSDKLVPILQEHQYSGAYLSETALQNLKVDKKMTLVEIEDITRCFIVNLQNEVLSDINIRLAFASAVDVEELCKITGKTYSGLVPLAAKGMSDGEVSLYNTEKASQYLKAGLDSLGVENVSITILTQTEYEETLKIALQNWQKTLGVNMFISVEAVSEAEMKSRVKAGNYDIAFYPLRAKTPCAEDFFSLFEQGSSNNIIRLEDEGYDTLVHSLYSSGEADFDKIYSEVEDKLLATAAIIPVWSESTFFVCTEKARGIICLAGEDTLYLHKATDVD